MRQHLFCVAGSKAKETAENDKCFYFRSDRGGTREHGRETSLLWRHILYKKVEGVYRMNNYISLCSVFRRRANAAAFVTGSEKYPNIQGRVLFYQMRDGVIVRAEITGLPRGEGACDSPIFAFHIHGSGNCTGNHDDAFADTGVHYNPNSCQHPYHAGDLPPLFGSDGKALSVCLTNRFNVNEIIGKAVIIHLSPDDFKTQPSGNSGEKIACGVIMPTAKLI